LPSPEPLLLVAGVPLFESDVSGLKASPTFNVNASNKIITISVVADCPDYAGRGRLWSCLWAELYGPLLAVTVVHIDLFRGATLVAPHKSKFRREIRGIFLATHAIIQIAARNVAGVFPEDRAAFDLVGVQDSLFVLLIILIIFLATRAGLILLVFLVLFRSLARRRVVLSASSETRPDA